MLGPERFFIFKLILKKINFNKKKIVARYSSVGDEINIFMVVIVDKRSQNSLNDSFINPR